MKSETTHNYIARWSDALQAHGRYGFAVSELKSNNNEFSDLAIKFALKRLADKGKLLPVFKGYYLIIPPQYFNKGILPPTLYLDAFMKHLQRPYYVGLLNAAAFYGASHQQPQEYFVMTRFPVVRPTQKKGLKLNYISIKNFPEELIEKRKTEAGYLNVSNAALTACDLVQFEKRIGGLNRAATVINELSEVIKTTDFSITLLQHTAVTALQRFGYILESACFNKVLADALFATMEREKMKFFRIPLKAAKQTKGYSSDNRWNVIVNTEIALDE